jgi:16S rRNA (guanine527-N7)-methyltransferase
MPFVMPPFDELESLLREAALAPDLARPLARYGTLVLDANRSVNLTGARTPPELAFHLLDSLSVLPYLREPYVDVGSGAGLPAIPVAIATGMPVTMIESAGKKARFLASTLERLGLKGGEVCNERAEAAGQREEMREHFASGTVRAVGTAPTVLELLLPLIAVGGVAVLQRGSRDRNDRAALDDAALMLGGYVEREDALEGGRRIILIRKRSTTPHRFPRRAGVPAKRPLCS